jgi:hypothetical protein
MCLGLAYQAREITVNNMGYKHQAQAMLKTPSTKIHLQY